MSRSRKRSPVAKMKNSGWAKKMANRAVRRDPDVPDGKAYRRDYDPWEICDWRGRPESLAEYMSSTGFERDGARYRKSHLMK